MGSFLQARSHGGVWLVRIDDVDTPRNIDGASDEILRTLEKLELLWDEEVVYQSARSKHYRRALEQLAEGGVSFACACSRKEVAGTPYPGTCRRGTPDDKPARSVRIIADTAPIRLHDGVQGRFEQDLSREVGDFVILRGDGETAYHLATVVDDAAQGITEIVRGCDLLDSTPRQIHLQRSLEVPTPRYAHLPVAVNKSGHKLSKQTYAPALDDHHLLELGFRAVAFLGQRPPEELLDENLDVLWTWAIDNWDIQRVPGEPTRLPTD